MMPQPAAFGLYPSTKALHFGAEALRAARFRQTDISVMYSDGSQAMRLREAESPAEADVADDEPETLGDLLSALSGIGALSMRNDGPYMAAGPILATLIGGCQELLASLRGLGIPDTTVQCFEDKLKQGGLLLSVQCEDEEWAERAQQILHQTGAEHVSATM